MRLFCAQIALLLAWTWTAPAQITNVSLGTGPNTGTGDGLYQAFQKLNWNDSYFLTNMLRLNSSNVNLQGTFTGGAILSNLWILQPDPVVESFYVDSVYGSDANSGASIYAPLKSLSAVAAKGVSGKRVYLAKGSHWREQWNDVNSTNVTITTYGTGDRPLIDASDLIPSASWSAAAGLANTYMATVTNMSGAAATKTWIGLWENGTHLRWVATTNLVATTPGSYTIPQLNTSTYTASSPSTIYVHPADNSNPGSNGKTYECASRMYGLRLGVNCWIEGVHARRNLHNDGSLFSIGATTLKDCLASDGQYHSVWVGNGATLINVGAPNSYHPNAGNPFIWYGDGSAPPAGGTTRLTNCWAYVSTNVPGNNVWGGFGGHGSGYLDEIVLSGCKVTNEMTEGGFSISLPRSLVMENCYVGPTVTNAVAIYTATNVTIAGLTVPQAYRSIIAVNGHNQNIVLTGVNARGSGIGAFWVQGTNTSLDVRSSVFSNVISMTSVAYSPTLWRCRSNTIESTTTTYDLRNFPAVIDCDYNTTVGKAVRWYTTNATWAVWRSTSGQDAHSTP